jgi:hypothetical protein
MNDFIMSPAFAFYGILVGLFLISGIVLILYKINAGLRRNIKKTGDDARIEKELEEGDTLHAEGIYGDLHPDEMGLPLKQTRKQEREERQKSARP